jgi:hypothetical protein
MKIGQKVSYVRPLLQQIVGETLPRNFIPFDEYRVSILCRPRAAVAPFTNLKMDELNELITNNVILWVSPYCFIMKEFFEASLHSFLSDLDLSPTEFAHTLCRLTIHKECTDKIEELDFCVYSTSDINRNDTYNEASQVFDALLVWIGTLDLEYGRNGTRLEIEGAAEATLPLTNNISLTADVLHPIKGIQFNHLELNEDSCRAIHDARLDTIWFGDCVTIPNVAALQLNLRAPLRLGFVFTEHDESPTTPYALILASLTEASNVTMLSLNGSTIDFSGVVLPALQANTFED